ncbi:MAG: SRPBCC domain-containing protein [Planctomycetes bacterium]|nr:SRPBCC domain-containing protein [Planctomycetota bacterium]
MQRITPETQEPTDAACRQATGKTLAQWFAVLDQSPGPAAGRRELAQAALTAVGKDEWWATTLAVEYEKARGQREKDGRPRGYSICVTKTVAAPLPEVFAAFGKAELLARWFGAGSSVHFADGGVLRDGDGDQLTFTRIRADKDLRASWQSSDLAPDSQVEVLFADKGKGRTGITLNHTRIQLRRDADVLRLGWGQCLQALRELLEAA